MVVPLTTRLHLAELPGNVRFDRRSTGLPKAAVANVYDVQKVLRSDFLSVVGVLAGEDLAALGQGLRLVFDL